MDKLHVNLLKDRLLALAEHPNGNVRRMVALAIREFNIKEEVVTILNNYIVDKQWMVRLEAAKTIRYIPGNTDSACSFIAKRLGVNYSELRTTILSIMAGNVTTEKEGDIAKKELVGEVKKELAISAAWLDHSLLIDPLLSSMTSDNSSAKIAGAVGLGNIGHKKSAEKLHELATSEKEEIKVRRAAIVAIGKIKDSESFATLKTIINDSSDDIRREVVIAMNHIKPEDPDDIYLKLLKDDSYLVREVACIALGNLKKKEYMPKIIELLDDTQPAVRKAAADVLGSWRELSSAESILKHINDKNEYVQNEIALAYLRIPRNTGMINMEEYLLEKDGQVEEVNEES